MYTAKKQAAANDNTINLTERFPVLKLDIKDGATVAITLLFFIQLNLSAFNMDEIPLSQTEGIHIITNYQF